MRQDPKEALAAAADSAEDREDSKSAQFYFVKTSEADSESKF